MAASTYQLHILKSDYSAFRLIPLETTTSIASPILFEHQAHLIRGYYHDDIIEYDGQHMTLITRTPSVIYIVGEIELTSPYLLTSSSLSKQVAYPFRPLQSHHPKCAVSCSLKKEYSSSNVMAVVCITAWPSHRVYPEASVYHLIGESTHLWVLQESLLRDYQLYPSYPKLNKGRIRQEFGMYLQQPQDREIINGPILSIDPEGCLDIDDAFSIADEHDKWVLQIHVADVYTVLQQCKYSPDVIRVSSMYVPETTGSQRVLGMLPDVFSSDLASLLQGKSRVMITLEYTVDKHTHQSSFRWFFSAGTITNNFTYDNVPRWIERHYSRVEDAYFALTHQTFHIGDTHEWIECLMLMYNFYFGNHVLQTNPHALFRIQCPSTELDYELATDPILCRFQRLLQSQSAEYSHTPSMHHSLQMNAYVHVSSPIRRLADLWNQECLHRPDKPVWCIKHTIASLNQENKQFRLLSRKLQKLCLAEKVYRSTERYVTHCYVYEMNLEQNEWSLYFPKEQLSMTVSIVDDKIFHLTRFEWNEKTNTLWVQNDHWHDGKNIQLYECVRVGLCGKPDVFHLSHCLNIEWL